MIRIFRHYVSRRKAIFVVGEGVLIYCSVSLAAFLFLGEYVSLDEMLADLWPKIFLVAVVTQISLYFNDLYDFKATENMIEMGTRLIQAVGITSVILAVIYFLYPGAMIGKWVFFISILLMVCFLVSWRLLYAYIIQKRLFAEKAILIGDGDLARDILKEIRHRRDVSYDIRWIVGAKEREGSTLRAEELPVQMHYGFEDISGLAEREQASSIIVALDQKRGVMPYQELLKCKLRGISIIDGESFYERVTGKLLVEKISPSWFIFSDGFVKSRTSRFIKRVVGLVISLVMLVVLFPIMVLTAIAIKLESKGTVFFSQKRVGENGVEFTLHKFRSMKQDAEKETGPVWAADEDPRITRVGRIIRKLRIDELPQLWNVVRGDMSFVGPRPERAFFVEQLKRTVPYYNERFAVKPGVTGWAQVKYAYGATEEDALEKLRYDLYYIKNMSPVMDLMVILLTIKIVLLGRGSR
jgi:sugar transferase (PEP-CTERM system associated)